MNHYDYDEDVIHLDVKYDDDGHGDQFHCMTASEMQEAYDAYEDHSGPRFQLSGPLASILDTEVEDPELDFTMDHVTGYSWKTQNSDLPRLREDPNIMLSAKRKEMEQYETDRKKHINDKKSLDVLKTMKSMYGLQSFVDTYSNALETVRDFFHRYSKIMSIEETQWARTEIEYMRALRQSLQDLNNTIYDDGKTKVDVQQTQIMQSVKIEDEEKRRLMEIERSDDMSESAISELKTRIRSRIIRSDTVDRENLERMGVLMHEMNTLLSKPNNKILEDVVWKSQVVEFVKFLEYRKNKSRLDVWKLEINVMEITDLLAYKNMYSSVWKDAEKYLSLLGHESLEDKSWKMNERFYGEYIAQVEALHIQVAKLSNTKRSKKEAFQTTEQILMKIDFIEKKMKFAITRSENSWQNEKEYMDYLRNLATLEAHSDEPIMTYKQISQDIRLYEMKNKHRVVFENGV